MNKINIENTNLKCPIRGYLKIKEKNKKEEYLEEYYRIELLNILLKKEYPKKDIILEYKKHVGNNPKNKEIRIDILVKKDNKNYIVCEIKRDNKNNAIENQLKPAIKLLDAEIGIYYDGNENIILHKDIIYNLSKLPNYNNNLDYKKIKLDDLLIIKDINFLYKHIDQLSYNHGISKDDRYKGLFQIIITKYFDEKYNFNDLKFKYYDTNLYEKINNLYEKAKIYYQDTSNIKIEFLERDLILSEPVIKNIINYLEQYSFLNSELEIIQSFFMKFGTTILKKDLQQFYTPYTIIKFIASILNIKNTDLIIDPAGGTADFLIGILNKYKKIDSYKNNLFYYDVSKDASYLAFINMILHGDGKTHIETKDTIYNHSEKNDKFDFVITNPPFGNQTIWNGNLDIMNHYYLGKKNNKNIKQQLGILFIERSLKFLKNNGILVIILPSGYLNNKSQKFIRDYLINNTQIIGCISLPDGSFKGAGTSVKTEILIIKKCKNESYNIFFSTVKNIGFNYKKDTLPPLYKKNINNGEFILDEKNNKILDNDFDYVKKQFLKFIYDNNIDGFEKENYKNITYDYENINTIKNDKLLTIKPELYNFKYKCHIKEIKNKTKTLFDIKNNYLVSNNDNIKKDIILNNNYFYIGIKNTSKGDYFLDNELKGWEIKEIDRAKQIINKYDICISYLNGSKNKFFIMLDDNTENIIVSNGFYKIKIEDELYRLSFYKFLFTKSYNIQFDALTTGHIQTNITLEKIKNFRFPLLNKKELEEFKNIINSLKNYKLLQRKYN